MTEPTDERRPPPSPDGTSISFPCRRCRYEIRGISLEGRCPECGEAIWRTLSERVDLTAAMIDPETCRRTGRVLPVVAGIVAATTTLSTLPPAAWPWTEPGGWLEASLGIGLSTSWWTTISTVLWTLSGLVAASAAISLGRGSFSEETPPVPALAGDLAKPLHRPRLLLWASAGGCLAAATVAAAPTPLRGFAGPLALAATGVGLLAAGLLAERLGPGSRRWRGGGDARQSPWLVAGSLAAAASISAGRQFLSGPGFAAPAALAELLAAALMFLAVVGGWYLAANLIWIGGDLRRRRPRLERMLAEGSVPPDEDRTRTR